MGNEVAVFDEDFRKMFAEMLKECDCEVVDEVPVM